MIRRLLFLIALELLLLMLWKLLVDACRAWLSWRTARDFNHEVLKRSDW